MRNYVVKRYLLASSRIPVLAQWFLSSPRDEHCKLLICKYLAKGRFDVQKRVILERDQLFFVVVIS